MGYILASGQEAATAAQRVYEIFDTDPAIADPPAAHRAAAAGRRRRGRPGSASTTSTFRYPGAVRAGAARTSAWTSSPGETVALVGPNGAGKTTLLQLVPRLAEVSGGSILLDGTDIRDLPLAVLRTLVGCAFEDPTLFSASVRENVSYGAPDADRGGGPGRARRGPGGLRRRPALGPGHQDRRAGHGAVRRPAPAGGAGPGHPGQARRCCCSTTRCPRWTCTPRPRSPGRCAEVLAESTALVVAHRPSTVLLADRVALLDDGVIAADRHARTNCWRPSPATGS